MRAIIRCYSTATREQWAKILRHCEWWSSVPQDDDVVTTQYDQILNLIADEDRQLVKKTYWFMIFNSDVKSWDSLIAHKTMSWSFAFETIPPSSYAKHASTSYPP